VRKVGGEEGLVLEADQGMRLLHSSQGSLFAPAGKVNSRIMLKTTAWYFFIFLSLFFVLWGWSAN